MKKVILIIVLLTIPVFVNATTGQKVAELFSNFTQLFEPLKIVPMGEVLGESVSSSPASSCSVYISTCQAHSSMNGQLAQDSWNNSNTNEAACIKRANDFYDWCGNTNSSQWVQSYYEVNKIRQGMATAPGNYLYHYQGPLSLSQIFNLGSRNASTPNPFVQVLNSSGQALPRDWAGLTKNTATGGAGPASNASAFGGSGISSNSALYLVPPQASNDYTRINFPITLKKDLTWNLNFKVGMSNSSALAKPVTFQVIVSGDTLPNVENEASSEVRYTGTIAPGVLTNQSVPLGLWPLRSNFKISIQVQRQALSTATMPLVIVDGLSLIPGNPRPEPGIQRWGVMFEPYLNKDTNLLNTLLWQTAASVAEIHAHWMRDMLFTDWLYPGFILDYKAADAFTYEVKSAKQNGLKFLAVLVPLPGDFDSTQTEVMQGVCGKVQPFSAINLNSYKQRLDYQFSQISNAGITIDAFQIGNEYDNRCFNGDIPFGQPLTSSLLQSSAKAYAKVLEASSQTIKKYFPNAKIIIFGMTGVLPKQSSDPYLLPDSAAFVALLKNIDGVNYLQKYVDGYGVHLYPDVNSNGSTHLADAIAQGKAILQNRVSALGNDKPYWITEWGMPANGFPFANKNAYGESRSQFIEQFLDMLNSYTDATIALESYYNLYSQDPTNNDPNSLALTLFNHDNVNHPYYWWLPEAHVLGDRYVFP